MINTQALQHWRCRCRQIMCFHHIMLFSSARFYFKAFLNPTIVKSPRIRSVLSGQMWVDELLSGHDKVFYENMGMNKPVFVELRGRLKASGSLSDSRWVTSTEQLALLLYFIVTGLSNTKLNQCFQRSADTVSK